MLKKHLKLYKHKEMSIENHKSKSQASELCIYLTLIV